MQLLKDLQPLLLTEEKKQNPNLTPHRRSGSDFAHLVRQKGLEPPTYWFVASYSIQLSYCRMPHYS